MKKPSNAGLNPWILAGIFFGVVLLMSKVNADELVHEFKNPSFSGIGTSAHYLTVENQEKSRRDAIAKDLEAALKQGLDAPYSCQGGICSSCIARVTEGTAVMRKNQILTDDEVEEGLILTCQALAT